VEASCHRNEASGFGRSGFGIDKNIEHQTSRNRDMRFPDKAYRLWATQESVEDRWKANRTRIGISGIGGSGIP
jgi:hypothetical protein